MRSIRIISVILLAGLLAFTAYRSFFVRDTVYVDIGKVLENYTYKKELEKNATGNLMVVKNMIDSLRLVGSMKAAGPERSRLDSNVSHLESEFARYIRQSNEAITQKVWERLNPAIQQFGKEHSYKIIVGANGMGTVLYGDPRCDITNELTAFVNKSYEKGN